MNNDLTMINTEKSDKEASSALEKAKNLVIVSVQDYQSADDYCKGLFHLRKTIEGDFAESLRKATEAKRAATEAKSALDRQIESHIAPVQDAERIIKGKMMGWSQEQERIRRIEQDRLRAEALKQAEDEKLKKAAALETQGKKEQAMAELEKPIRSAPIILPPAPVERKTTISSYWSYQIVNDMEVKRDFCEPDRGAITKMMNAMKAMGKTMADVEAVVGGIRVEEKVK